MKSLRISTPRRMDTAERPFNLQHALDCAAGRLSDNPAIGVDNTIDQFMQAGHNAVEIRPNSSSNMRASVQLVLLKYELFL